MDRWKAEQGRGREKRKIRRGKMQMREKVGKSRNTVFFQWFVAPEGRKVGPLKWRVRRQLARWEMKNCTTKHTRFGPLLEVAMSKKCTPLWREAHFEVKMYKTHQVRTTFGSWDVEKVYAVVARSTFWSQNVQNTPGSDHFWKLRCRKSVRRCGAKHILKSKCTKHTRFGPLLEVEMSKKRTPLRREAHFEVKMYKTPNVRATFGGSDVEKVHAVVARSTFRSQNVQNTTCSRHFWRFGCWKSARRCDAKHILKSKCTKRHMFAPLFEVRMLKKCATFRSSDVEKVHAVVARSTFRSQNVQNTTCSRHFWRFGCWKSARRCGAKHISKSKCTKYSSVGPLLEVEMSKKCTPLWRQNVQTTRGSDHFWRFRCRFASRHNTTEHHATLHYTTLHSSTLHYTKLHYTTLHYTEWHCNTDRQVDS